jgi:hypothetical protein
MIVHYVIARNIMLPKEEFTAYFGYNCIRMKLWLHRRRLSTDI